MYLGIDNGGTSVKAVVFDKTGRRLGSAAEELPLFTPGNGRTERDMEELWRANCRVIRRAVAESGASPGEIKGAACTGHGKGLYLWGADGAPAMNGIVSTDTRAWMYPERWEKDGTAEKAFAKTCQRILACQPVSLLRWLRDNAPDVLANVRWAFGAKDYIRFRLTGEARAELTDISGSGLLNLWTKDYDADLLRLYGLESVRGALPPLARSGEVCGRVTAEAARLCGLPEGLPVAGGMFDIDACAIAMDITDEENIAVIAGTWSINEYISKKPVLDGSVMMNSLYCDGEYYLIEESSPTSAGNLTWFLDKFMPDVKGYGEFDALAGSVPPDSENPVFLPFLFGSNYNPRAKAALAGMDGGHTKAQIARAVLEGVCFCHKTHVDRLLGNRARTGAVRLAGGAAKSLLWAQIFADILELPVELID
ncbi:MAG: carbohydrate kinase, partial [Firmicutes bacterium]|nr:carbohydrate kinase [Bacillota bacterium]